MSIVTTYPGVYLEENASSVFSVKQFDTAVPLFNMGPDGLNGYYSPIVRFETWLDVVNFFNGNVNLNYGCNAGLRAYFELGGGPCYAAHYKSFANAVVQFGDRVTLAVQNAYDPSYDFRYAFTQISRAKTLFALLEMPADDLLISDQTEFLSSFSEMPYAALYYPCLTADWTTADIPASAVVAALYCQNDRTRGVWKAPANLSLPAGYRPKFAVTDALQAKYSSGKAINMIRSFGQGAPVIWGARTMEDSDNWRYIPVRRLFDSVERDMQNALAGMMFEPNTPLTWEKVRSAASSYLRRLWLQGGLAGTSEDEAFFVQIGKDVTMSEDDIQQGKMIMKIGLAATRPAEFIILQFTQSLESA
jgi:uncharacterized protein